MQLQSLINKWTVRTTQHDDHVIQHMPHGCWDRHTIASWRMINITLHINWQYASTYFSNNSGIQRTDSTTGYSRETWLFEIKIAQTKIMVYLLFANKTKYISKPYVPCLLCKIITTMICSHLYTLSYSGIWIPHYSPSSPLVLLQFIFWFSSPVQWCS